MQTCPPQGHPNTTHSEPKRASQTKARQTNFLFIRKSLHCASGRDVRKQSRIRMTKKNFGLGDKQLQSPLRALSAPGRVGGAITCKCVLVEISYLHASGENLVLRWVTVWAEGPFHSFIPPRVTRAARHRHSSIPGYCLLRNGLGKARNGSIENIEKRLGRGWKTLRNALGEVTQKRSGKGSKRSIESSRTVWERLENGHILLRSVKSFQWARCRRAPGASRNLQDPPGALRAGAFRASTASMSLRVLGGVYGSRRPSYPPTGRRQALQRSAEPTMVSLGVRVQGLWFRVLRVFRV